MSDDIREMTNTELDALIGTKVMGWHKDYTSTVDFEKQTADRRDVYFIKLPSGKTASMELEDWHPTEDIS